MIAKDLLTVLAPLSSVPYVIRMHEFARAACRTVSRVNAHIYSHLGLIANDLAAAHVTARAIEGHGGLIRYVCRATPRETKTSR